MYCFFHFIRWLRLIADEGHEMGVNKNLRKKFATSSSAAHRGSNSLPTQNSQNNQNSHSAQNSLHNTSHSASQSETKSNEKSAKSLKRKSMSNNDDVFLPSTSFIFGLAAERRYVCTSKYTHLLFVP